MTPLQNSRLNAVQLQTRLFFFNFINLTNGRYLIPEQMTVGWHLPKMKTISSAIGLKDAARHAIFRKGIQLSPERHYHFTGDR
jgi:hypothetical protein